MVVHAYYFKDARVQRYAEFLAELGHNVDVLCLNEGDEPQWEVHNGVTIYRINLSRSRGGYINYVLEYFFSFLKLFFMLIRMQLTGKKYNIIHIHNFPNCLVFVCFFQKISGASIILDIHDPMPELFMSKYCVKKSNLLIKLLLAEERLSLKYADFVIAANDFFRELIVRRGCPRWKMAVILNVPSEKFCSESTSNQYGNLNRGCFEVLYIGTISERYGLETLLDAVGRLRNSGKIPNIRLTFIPKLRNEGNYSRMLLKKVAMYGLGDRFRILEPVPHECIPKIIRDADVSVYTPHPDVHMNIALSLKIPEVIAIGRPMVTSRLSVLQRYFGDNSLLMFEPGNVDECAAKILEVYEYPEEAKLRVERAQKVLEQYSWEKQKVLYLKIINSFS